VEGMPTFRTVCAYTRENLARSRMEPRTMDEIDTYFQLIESWAEPAQDNRCWDPGNLIALNEVCGAQSLA